MLDASIQCARSMFPVQFGTTGGASLPRQHGLEIEGEQMASHEKEAQRMIADGISWRQTRLVASHGPFVLPQ